jgi:mannobiose 2-epimerase
MSSVPLSDYDELARAKARAAEFFDADLRERVMPYWYATLDRVNGGYTLADKQHNWRSLLRGAGIRARLVLQKKISAHTALNPPTPKEKHVVTQARMVYGFSHVHRLGYSDPQHDYLHAAEWGYRFLMERLYDRQHGGFYWRADPQGRILDNRKFIVGQGMVMYALVEYHRASGLAEPLAQAMSLFRLVQEKLRDTQNLGWNEHAEADWRWMTPPAPDVLMDKVGLRGGNALIHWMEPLSELYDVTQDSDVRAALEESLRLCTTMFFPPDPARIYRYRTPDWREVTGPDYDGFSYGHNIEFAWMMLRAQEVLGLPLAWEHFDAIVKHTLREGFDRARGGIYNSGYYQRPATDTEKIWWAQAEGLYALADALQHGSDSDYAEALERLLSWILNYQRLPDGIWMWSTTAQGEPKNRTKASSWKGAYHDVRAITKFIAVFAPKALSPVNTSS